MILLRDHNYIVSQSLDYKSHRHVTSKQNFIDMMTQHRIKKICSVNNTRSSYLKLSLKQPNATFTELLGHPALIVAHIHVSMNLERSRQMFKNQKKDKSLRH
jgi:hypothetical protein